MDLQVGSDLYRNTDGTIEIEGVPQIQICVKPSTNTLLVTFALFDETGVMKAKVVDSTLMFNDQRAYELTRASTRLTLTHSTTKKIVLQFELKTPDLVSFTHGGFYSVKGHLFEVSPTGWRIDKQQSNGSSHDLNGGTVKLG